MGQQEIKQALDGAIDYLTANPDEARYTDSPATARLTDPQGLRADVSGPDDASMSTDMPTSVAAPTRRRVPAVTSVRRRRAASRR